MTGREPPADSAYSEEEPVSQTIVSIISEKATCDPVELDPLYKYIDPDALDSLFRSSRYGTDRDDIILKFTYMTYRITVTGNNVHVSEELEENGLSEV